MIKRKSKIERLRRFPCQMMRVNLVGEQFYRSRKCVGCVPAPSCVCAHICTCMYIYIYMYICTHIHKVMHTYIHMYPTEAQSTVHLGFFMLALGLLSRKCLATRWIEYLIQILYVCIFFIVYNGLVCPRKDDWPADSRELNLHRRQSRSHKYVPRS